VEVKAAAEEGFIENIDIELSGTVFSAGCSNWYVNKEGRNSASWPGYAANYWYKTIFPRWNDFVLQGGSSNVFKRVYNSVFGTFLSKIAFVTVLATAGLMAKETDFGHQLHSYFARSLY